LEVVVMSVGTVVAILAGVLLLFIVYEYFQEQQAVAVATQSGVGGQIADVLNGVSNVFKSSNTSGGIGALI
jgi:hypothetical protein